MPGLKVVKEGSPSLCVLCCWVSEGIYNIFAHFGNFIPNALTVLCLVQFNACLQYLKTLMFIVWTPVHFELLYVALSQNDFDSWPDLHWGTKLHLYFYSCLPFGSILSLCWDSCSKHGYPHKVPATLSLIGAKTGCPWSCTSQESLPLSQCSLKNSRIHVRCE